jgi:hypothetical protein
MGRSLEEDLDAAASYEHGVSEKNHQQARSKEPGPADLDQERERGSGGAMGEAADPSVRGPLSRLPPTYVGRYSVLHNQPKHEGDAALAEPPVTGGHTDQRFPQSDQAHGGGRDAERVPRRQRAASLPRKFFQI